MIKTEDAILELMLSTSSIHGVSKIQIKNLLKKTMEDIRKFQKGHEQERKQIKLLTAEMQKLNQKLQILLEENRAFKYLAKMPLNDEMARNVARRELAREKVFAITKGNMWNRKETIKLKDIERIPRGKKARRKKKSIKDPNQKQKRKNLDKKKAKARVKAQARARKRLSQRRKKKIIKCRTTYKKNQNNLNLYRVNRI